MCKIFLKLTEKTPNRRQMASFLVALLLTLYIALANSIEFEHINGSCAEPLKKDNFKNSCFVK